MKMMKIKKNIIQRVIVSTLMCSFSFSFPVVDDPAHLDSLNIAATFIHTIDKQFVDLVSTKVKTPMNTCLIDINKTLEDLRQKGNAITRSNDEITIVLHNLFEYVVRRFNIAYDILKKYNGKSNLAAELSVELKREFNTEEIFTEILRQLRAIKGISQQRKLCNLIKKVDTLIAMVEKKRKEWNARSEFTLFTGLTYRLQCK